MSHLTDQSPHSSTEIPQQTQNIPQKPGRFSNLTLHTKLIISFGIVAIIPLVLQTYLSTVIARSFTLDMTNQILSADTSSIALGADDIAEIMYRQSFAIWFSFVHIAIVAVSTAAYLAKRLSTPINRLLPMTRQLAGGALGVEMPVAGHYEADQVAEAFNNLTGQIRELIDTSERQIARRTQALETVVRSLKATTEISHRITTILELDELLQYVVDRIQSDMGYYHVHIYLIDEEKEELVMTEGSGEVGRQLRAKGHRLKMGQGIVGTVAGADQYFLTNNVDQTPNFVRNPLLPDTHAELAVPLRKAGQVLGVLDIQSRQTDRFEPQDVALIQSLANQTAVAVDNARLFGQITQANQEIHTLNERLKEENVRMEAELGVTRQLQKMLLPTEKELRQIDGLDIVGYMEPAEEVGGDYYDVLRHNGRLKIGIGDVTGHGLESGVLMLMVQTAVRTLLTSGEKDPVRFMDILNQTLHSNIQRMGVDKSLSLALLDYEQGNMKVSGQHEQLMVVRKDGQVELKDTMDLGFPIGLEAGIAQFVNEISIDLHPGDGIVLYSDGFTEAENEAGEFYGLERLCGVVSQHWANPAENIKQMVVDDVRQFIGQQTVYDDLTLLVVKQK